jgi:MFS family permease
MGRPVLLTNVTAVIAGFAMFGAFSLVPRFIEAPSGLSAGVASSVHYGFGASATRAGLYLLPMSLAMLVAGPVAGLAGRLLGSKWPLSGGMALIALATGMLAGWHDRPVQIVVALVVLGVGVAFAYASMPALITEAVAQTETGIATGINTVMRTIGGVIGGQVGASVLTSSTIGATSVPTEHAYTAVFLLSSSAALSGAFVAALLARSARTATTPLRAA